MLVSDRFRNVYRPHSREVFDSVKGFVQADCCPRVVVVRGEGVLTLVPLQEFHGILDSIVADQKGVLWQQLPLLRLRLSEIS